MQPAEAAGSRRCRNDIPHASHRKPKSLRNAQKKIKVIRVVCVFKGLLTDFGISAISGKWAARVVASNFLAGCWEKDSKTSPTTRPARRLSGS
jgi:hypothetical protein